MLQRSLEKLPITSITPFTFQDFPEHTACILWFSGCNMKCGYCHNPELVRGEFKKLPFNTVQGFLESRKGLLEGVVLSGGECMLCPQLPELARYLKELGFKVKVDTNGTNPEMLKFMLNENLLDFVALDFKAPKEKFSRITGFNDYSLFEQSLALLCKSIIPLEVRTTVHTALIDENDICRIIDTLTGNSFQGIYAIQKFRKGNTLANLPEPEAELNTQVLPKTSFQIIFRNF